MTDERVRRNDGWLVISFPRFDCTPPLAGQAPPATDLPLSPSLPSPHRF